jgi:hypothetical protein
MAGHDDYAVDLWITPAIGGEILQESNFMRRTRALVSGGMVP